MPSAKSVLWPCCCIERSPVCERCSMAIHQRCYGVLKFPTVISFVIGAHLLPEKETRATIQSNLLCNLRKKEGALSELVVVGGCICFALNGLQIASFMIQFV